MTQIITDKEQEENRRTQKSPSPRQVVERWVVLFNAADVSGLSELYHDDAVNHQVANEPVVGKENIRCMFEQEFAAAEMVCIVENLFEDGEWAILEWRDPLGLRGCGFFHVADGKIKFQRGYWDKLSFLRQHGLPLPTEKNAKEP
jgi:limonene-1,2-epoxide hydrolase